MECTMVSDIYEHVHDINRPRPRHEQKYTNNIKNVSV